MKFLKKLSLVLALSALPLSALASTIAIIDSGTDYKHKDMAAQYHVNPTPSQTKQYKDDVYGWNFAENNNVVIDYTYLDRLKPSMPDINKYFELQVRAIEKIATPEELAWMKAKRENLRLESSEKLKSGCEKHFADSYRNFEFSFTANDRLEFWAA